jgi:DNA-binding response OmpR family regulator
VQATILLVEGDASVAVPLVFDLQDQGFQVLHAADGHWGLKLARAAQPALILLDVTLPQMDGFALCRILRGESTVPILLLIAGGREHDRVKGLELGADGCIVKPFSSRELVAQVRALLRRCELDCGQTSPLRSRITVGDIVLDRAARQV